MTATTTLQSELTSTNVKEIVRMEALMPKKNVRVFAAACMALGKIGKEVIVEADMLGQGQQQGRITLRTMNDARTAHCTILFHANFFERFQIFPASDITQQQQPQNSFVFAGEESNRENNIVQLGSVVAKVPLKTFLSVFRSTRTVEFLSLSLVQQGSRHLICFRTSCNNSIQKTYLFYYEECQVFHPQFDSIHALHRIRTRPTLLTEVLNHIHGTDEITINATPSGLQVQSYYASSSSSTTAASLALLAQNANLKNNKKKPVAALLTEMHIPAEDLDGFEFTCPGNLIRQRVPISESSKQDAFSCGFTFGLREFKAVLQFCESNGVEIEDMTLFFNDPGTPFLFTSDYASSETNITNGEDESLLHPHSYIIELVMATLPSRISQNSNSSPSRQIGKNTPPPKSTTTTVPESTQVIGNKSKKRFRRIFDDDYDNGDIEMAQNEFNETVRETGKIET